MRIFGVTKRGIIFWGIFLVFLGTFILFSNYQILGFPFKFSRDWPMILIAWGILKIIDVLTGRGGFKFLIFKKSKLRLKKKNYQEIIDALDEGKLTAEEAIRAMKEK